MSSMALMKISIDLTKAQNASNNDHDHYLAMLKDNDEDMNAYTRIRFAEIRFNLKLNNQPKQNTRLVAVTLDQLENTDIITAYLAQMYGISEEDCSFLLAKFGPKISTLRMPLDGQAKPGSDISVAKEIDNPPKLYGSSSGSSDSRRGSGRPQLWRCVG